MSALSAKLLVPQTVSTLASSLIQTGSGPLSPVAALSGTSPPKAAPPPPSVATKPKWSRQMSFTVALHRNALDATKTSVKYTRSLLSFIPTAVADSIQVTPVKLPRRENIIMEGMTAEQAAGQLDAEWVVHGPSVDAEWKRLRGLKVSKPKSVSGSSPTKLSSSAPPSISLYAGLPKPQPEETIILYFHGGAYFMGSPSTTRNLTSLFSEHSGSRVLSVGYRLAPEHPFPLPLHDAVSAYLSLIDPPSGKGMQKFKPEQIVLAGDSAGGGLAIALALWIRDNGGSKWKAPAGIVALAPWLDLTHSQPSFHLNNLDYIPPIVADPSHITSNHSDNDKSTHLPPTLIQLGSRERLRDEGLMFAGESFKNSPLRVEIYEDMVHIFQAFAAKGEEIATDALKRVGNFVRHLNGGGQHDDSGADVISHPTKKGFLYVSEGSVTEISRAAAMSIVAEAREELVSQSASNESDVVADESDVESISYSKSK
ncbi:Alpha/Beta hydrolase protein [Obelidium mucronatum]|nr:Alpha/Beta hydrolase protein [Obelidium mucronatum]